MGNHRSIFVSIGQHTPAADSTSIPERQRDKQPGPVTRQLSWPSVVLAGGVGLSLAASLAQAQPTLWGWVVAAVPSGAFLVAVSMIERRAARGPRPAAGRDRGPGQLSAPGRPPAGNLKRRLTRARAAAGARLRPHRVIMAVR